MRIARVLFARIPEYGAVKTRLAADLDDLGAYTIYRWLLRVQRRRFQIKPPFGHFFNDYVYYAPCCNRLTARWRFTPDLSGLSLRFRAQINGDLGERLAAAGAAVLKRHDLVCFWGADIPTLPPSIFEQAIALYPQSVLTLARDGGYAFLSVAREHFSAQVFSGIRWSTHHAGRDQLRALQRLRIPVVISGKVADLDRAKDFLRVLRELDWAGQVVDLDDLAKTLRQLRKA